MITKESENISIHGHIGTWYVIDQLTDERGSFFLLEHEKYGDEAACLIVNENGHLILDDVYNGFEDLDDVSVDEITRNWVREYLAHLSQSGMLFTRDIANMSVVFPIEALNTLSEKEVAIAEDLCLNDQGLSKHEFEMLSVSYAVDDCLMKLDAFGYGDGFENLDIFNDREKRVAYMKDFLSDPEGIKSIMSRLSGDVQEYEDDPEMKGYLMRLVDRLEDQWTRMNDALLWPQQNNEEDRER